MLSYPDRQKFEQIRSQWEAAQPASDRPSTMVGRREKSMHPPPLPTDRSCGHSRFRRKLSQGFSLLSHPLPQRKITPIRRTTEPSQSADAQTVASNALVGCEANELPTALRVSPSRGSPGRWTTPMQDESMAKGLKSDVITNPPPHSRTMSFLPRPSRSESMSSIDPSASADKALTMSVKADRDARATPTKIPTPIPSEAKHRCSSPRQHVKVLSVQQAENVAARGVMARTGAVPSNGSVRSYTTPNLMKSARSSPPTNPSVPRKATARILVTGIPIPQKPTTKENANPTFQRYSKRLSQIQETSAQPGSMEAGTVSSDWPQNLQEPVTHSEQSPATPPTAHKRRSTQPIKQIPLAAQRATLKSRNPLRPLEESTNTKPSSAIDIQTRLMGPVNPPAPLTARFSGAQPALPRSSTEKDFRKRSFTTPSKRMGGGILSRRHIGAGKEVRIPDSSTFLAPGDARPSMPSIPEQHKSFSMPVLSLGVGTARKSMETQPPIERSNANSHRHSGEARSQVGNPNGQFSASRAYSMETRKQQQIERDEACALLNRRMSAINAQAKPLAPVPRSSSHPLIFLSPRSWAFQRESSRPWLATAHQIDTDDVFSGQVKDYMPALYWAGRFQSRFDQWRTEAMKVELDPDYSVSGQQEQCKLSQENAAARQIFLQLRDLCVSNQAADSLWEFEYTYRKEHKMSGSTFNRIPPTICKNDSATPKEGPIGRAVRRITPRKSSFVNLLKGKGWGTGKDEPKLPDDSTYYNELSGGIHGSLEDKST